MAQRIMQTTQVSETKSKPNKGSTSSASSAVATHSTASDGAYTSVADLFYKRVQSTPDSKAYQFPQGEDGWQEMTWKEAEDSVRQIAAGLLSLGLEIEARAAILCSTRMEWILADLGIMCAGGATTTIYPSNTSEECAYIINDSACSIVFAEDDEQVAKLLVDQSQTPTLKHIISLSESTEHDSVMTLRQLKSKGEEYLAGQPNALEEIRNTLKPEHLATLIYTSGTTGTPKGVELLHRCWIEEGNAIDAANILHIDDHQYLWLPLAHSFGKVLQAAQLAIGFLTTVDGRIPKLVENLGVTKPTFMAAAPRIFEKVYNKVVTGAKAGGWLKFKIFTWAVGIGRKVSRLRQQGKEPSGLLAVKHRIADRLVFSKLKARFGGNIRFFVSGSAPLSREMAEFFHAADILILEGYGLTESSAASFVNLPQSYRFGTVGPALACVQVKIAEEDGEILIKGPTIMRGYHNKPEETAKTLVDGWLHTGDIGELTDDGLLRITDRKKDLIKTSGGKYVAPQALEGTLKSLSPYISQVIVHGNRRNFCSALISIDPESIVGWAEQQGLADLDYEALSQHAKTQSLIQEAVNKLNGQLASFETIKKFAILSKDLSIEDGELTASMKVKRKAVEKKYMDILDGFYEGAIGAI